MIHYDRRDKNITIIGSIPEVEGDFRAVMVGVREVLKKAYAEIANQAPEEFRPKDGDESVDKFVKQSLIDITMQVLYGDPNIEIANETKLSEQEADEILGAGGEGNE